MDDGPNGLGLVSARAAMRRLRIQEKTLFSLCERGDLTPRRLCSGEPTIWDTEILFGSVSPLGATSHINQIGFVPKEVEWLEDRRETIARERAAQAVPIVGVEAEGAGRAMPTTSNIQRLKDGGETNKQIAARYPDFFGYDKSNTTKDHWERVYGRMKAFMRGKYKGNPR